MRNSKLVVLLFILCLATNYSFSLTYRNSNLDFKSFENVAVSGNKTAVLSATKMIGHWYSSKIAVNENKIWTVLPTEFEIDGVKSKVLASETESTIKFDANNDLWLNGYSIYKFSNGIWNEYFINDSLREYRNYSQFCFDKQGLMWITTEIYNSATKFGLSELLVFDGKEFRVILKFPQSYSFLINYGATRGTTLANSPDGKVIVHRLFASTDVDVINNKTEDIYLFSSEKEYERIRLATPSGTDYDNYNKHLWQIYPEDNGNIWFCLAERKYSPDGNAFATCCSGLSLYESKGTWKTFDEKNGFHRNKNGLMEEIRRIIKTKDGSYLVLGEKCLYKMSQDYIATKLDWNDLLTNAEFVLSSSYYDGENGAKVISELVDTNNYLSAPIIDLFFNDNDELIVHLGNSGYLVIPNPISSIANTIDESDITVYPNPADETLRLLTKGDELSLQDFSGYRIYNILGESVQSGDFSAGNQVSLSTLSSGAYTLVLCKKDSKFEKISFVKK